MESVIINGKEYKYVAPTSYENNKLLKKQMKQIREKIRASQSGCYKDKLTKTGRLYYQDYPKLLEFLESLN